VELSLSEGRPSEEPPRDFVGYGAHPPDPHWPGGARLALNFVLNYEEGGESTPLDGDPASEPALHELIGAPATIGQRNLNVESMYEYGSRAGFWRIHRIFNKYGMPLTVYAIAQALARNPAAARAMIEAGWEVASHGYRWIDHSQMTEDEERTHMSQAIQTIEQLTGERPQGWYIGRNSPNTRRLVVEAGGLLYDSDSYTDDLPYWLNVAGQPHLVIPYTLDANDFKYFTVNGFVTGDDFCTYLRDSFDQLYEEGAENPKMMSVGLHCRIIGRPGRARGLDRFLEHVSRHSDVWIATRLEIARHWQAEHPPDATV
jgi:putative urate catabolism protein